MANEVPGASTVILSRNLLSWTVPSENGAEIIQYRINARYWDCILF